MANDSSDQPDTIGQAGPLTDVSFAELFRSSYPVLWGIALGMTGNRADAEDVVQEAALIGFRKRSTYEPGTRFHAWMAAIVRNTANNQRRKTTRNRHQELQDNQLQAAAPDRTGSLEAASQGVIQADLQAFDDQLLEALQSLTPVARACLLLRTVHELDYDAIAEVMDIPKNTALSHVHRARKTLREKLSGRAAPDTKEGGTNE
ncbi:MAG: sigma-70 family RNA polymerase sigma factor [Phycisphaeraceae bacterium]|nr:sigma-70 family RNA polymerase sigma factor [Phycisphaeraceae bacterium]